MGNMKKKLELPHKHNDKNLQEQIVSSLPSAETIFKVSDALKQLGDPSRLKIFWLLCHTEECVTDIAAMVDMSSPAVSHHLRLLKQADLIISRREGKEMLYKASDTELVNELHRVIETIASIKCPRK